MCVRPAVFATRIVCSTSRSTTTCWCEARKSRLDCAICSRSRSAPARARSRSAGGVELSQHLDACCAARRRPLSALVGLNLAHSSRSDLLAVEQLGRHPLGLELRAQRVDVRELLAHRPAVRLHRPLQRRRRQPAPPRPRQRRPRDVLARQERHDHVAADLHGGLRVGVQPQRLLHRRVQPPVRQRQRIARPRSLGHRPGARLHLSPAVGEQLRRGSPAARRCRSAASPRRAAGTPAAETRRRSSRARSPDISSGFGGVTLKIRTNAPSLVTISPVRSIASTAKSSPASRQLAAVALTRPFRSSRLLPLLIHAGAGSSRASGRARAPARSVGRAPTAPGARAPDARRLGRIALVVLVRAARSRCAVSPAPGT